VEDALATEKAKLLEYLRDSKFLPPGNKILR
jgi:hypothetical protein